MEHTFFEIPIPTRGYLVDEMSKIIVTASAFVAALVWRDTFQTFFEDVILEKLERYDLSKSSLQLIYTVSVTLIISIVSYYVTIVSKVV